MPIYYFNVRGGNHPIFDTAGVLARDVNDATKIAQAFERKLLAQKLEADLIIDGQMFEISDSTGAVVAVVPFRSTVRGH